MPNDQLRELSNRVGAERRKNRKSPPARLILVDPSKVPNLSESPRAPPPQVPSPVHNPTPSPPILQQQTQQTPSDLPAPTPLSPLPEVDQAVLGEDSKETPPVVTPVPSPQIELSTKRLPDKPSKSSNTPSKCTTGRPRRTSPRAQHPYVCRQLNKGPSPPSPTPPTPPSTLPRPPPSSQSSLLYNHHTPPAPLWNNQQQFPLTHPYQGPWTPVTTSTQSTLEQPFHTSQGQYYNQYHHWGSAAMHQWHDRNLEQTHCQQQLDLPSLETALTSQLVSVSPLTHSAVSLNNLAMMFLPTPPANDPICLLLESIKSTNPSLLGVILQAIHGLPLDPKTLESQIRTFVTQVKDAPMSQLPRHTTRLRQQFYEQAKQIWRQPNIPK